MHPTINNTLPEGIKMSAIQPIVNIIAAQQKLNPKKLSEYKKIKRIINLSINHN